MQDDNKFTVIGHPPCESGPEAAQFTRVLSILRQCGESIGLWCYLLLNHCYWHKAGRLIDVDKDWNGQIDILLISSQRILIYELKGFTAKILCGSTDSNEWQIQRATSGEPESVRSYFIQASRQRAFLLRDFLPRFNKRFPQYAHNHWVVDARLVFKPGSDLSGFGYSVPMTEGKETLQSKVLDKIQNEEDKAFVINAYSGIEKSTGKLLRQKLRKKDELRLSQIYQEHGIIPRTQKWFRVITEDRLPTDLQDTGSTKFRLDLCDAKTIIEDLLALSRTMLA